MGITYDAPSNTITVTGYTEGAPCTFEDIYQADVAGGWGVVSKQGTLQYLFDCKIVIGGISTHTWFADKNVQVVFSASAVSGNAQYLIQVKYRGHFRLGQLDDATNKLTSRGVQVTAVDSGYNYISIIYGQHSSADIQFYSSSFISTSPQGARSHQIRSLRNNAPVYNCLFDNVMFNTGSIDGYRITMIKGNIPLSRSSGTFDDLFIQQPDGYYVYWYQAETGNLKNFKGIGHTGVWGSIRVLDITVDHDIINGDLDAWTFNWGTGSTAKVYRKYTFNLKVTQKDGSPINGATVTLKDKDGNQVFQVTTDAQGEIAEQTVSRGYYDQPNGNTLQDYSPHALIIEKAGYQTYEKKFTMDKIDWLIKLPKAVGIFLDFGRPVVNLKKSEPENKNVMVL